MHGEAEAQKAKEASRALFAGAGDDSNMPTTEISEQALENGGILLPELMVACGLAASKTEARRLIQQGGVSVNEEKADSIGRVITAQELQKGVKLRRGKKVFRRAVLKS